MGVKCIPYHLLALLLTLVSASAIAQDEIPCKEKVQLCTDRTLYVTGEGIHFSALVVQDKETLADPVSQVLYCELVTPDGNKIAGGKYQVNHYATDGCLYIPEEAITGYYYLRAYTRWMRNASPDEYHYSLIKIINPNSTQVLSGHEEDTLKIAPPELTGVLAGRPGFPSVRLDKDRYSRREEIHLKVAGTLSEKSEKFCLSVIPENSLELITLPQKAPNADPGYGQYFPETRGISLTGNVVTSEGNKPLAGVKVNLSIINDRDIMVTRTDSSGRFFFALPAYHGKRDIFLCTEDIPGVTPVVYIDNDFCPRPPALPSPVFSLDEEETGTAYLMAVNQKLSTVYGMPLTVEDSPEQEPGASFYGEPTEVLVLDNYIELPTLEEYFSELPLWVKIRKSQGRKRFKFTSFQADMNIYDPLILIDWVAVDDMEKILSMSPRDIERIELVNAPYVKGNITYGGIVGFVSKKNDFAGIDLPSSGTFVRYGFLEPSTLDDYPATQASHLPDTRNTVYWNPDVQVNDEGTAEISFTAPDSRGKYVILLWGVGPDGMKILAREEIEVGLKD